MVPAHAGWAGNRARQIPRNGAKPSGGYVFVPGTATRNQWHSIRFVEVIQVWQVLFSGGTLWWSLADGNVLLNRQLLNPMDFFEKYTPRWSI